MIKDILQNSVFFGVLISIISYIVGIFLKKKFKFAFFNPLLISTAVIIIVLLCFDIDYKYYYDGAKYISYFMTPATVCLAIPLYEQFELLKENYKAILCGIFSGVLASLSSVFGMSILFGLTHKEYVTLLPKSITTAIGISVSEELGGYVDITVAVIIITGIIGNVFAETICRLFRIKEPVAIGVAIGTSSHALGTAKAIELGDIEGAMSSLSIAVAGIITVVGANIFMQFM